MTILKEKKREVKKKAEHISFSVLLVKMLVKMNKIHGTATAKKAPIGLKCFIIHLWTSWAKRRCSREIEEIQDK